MRALGLATCLALGAACSTDSGSGGGAPQPEARPEFAAVNAVIQAKCSDARCHGSTGNNSFIFVDAQATVEARKASIVHRLELRTANGVMPPPEAAPLTPDERSLLLRYCNP